MLLYSVEQERPGWHGAPGCLCGEVSAGALKSTDSRFQALVAFAITSSAFPRAGMQCATRRGELYNTPSWLRVVSKVEPPRSKSG